MIISIFLEQCNYSPISTVAMAGIGSLIKKYDLQLFDAMIVSAALEAGCEILYTEDMHHQLLVEAKLRIINPFI